VSPLTQWALSMLAATIILGRIGDRLDRTRIGQRATMTDDRPRQGPGRRRP
jgi:hypothetical protein